MCQAWRQIFTSRSSLWTDLDCVGTDKPLVYLERSKSSPINLSLRRDDDLPPDDPFFQIIPHVIGRLKSLSVRGTLENLQDITAHLSHPAPLLEVMLVDGSCEFGPEDIPVLTPTLFNGDLTSLRKLHLSHVRTELPWREMVNLTSLQLFRTSPVSVVQLLDFLESAPHLRKVELYIETPTSDALNGRLVSPACLELMKIGYDPDHFLLDHLLIPVGARLMVHMHLEDLLDEDRPATFLGNLRNLCGFTTILVLNDEEELSMQFEGPNGSVSVIPFPDLEDWTCSMLNSLVHFDLSTAEHLEIDRGYCPSSGPFRAVLHSMKNLRSIRLSECKSSCTFICALHPSTSSSGVMVCPKLEKFIFVLGSDGLGMKSVIEMAAARASRGAKLMCVTLKRNEGARYSQLDLLELEKHVLRVECEPRDRRIV